MTMSRRKFITTTATAAALFSSVPRSVWVAMDAANIERILETGIWPNTPPKDCPFLQSAHLSSLSFTGRHINYTNADTWYPSWASDGALYSPWTDGWFGDRTPVLECSSHGSEPSNAHRGGHSGVCYVKITGDDPMVLTLENLGIDYAHTVPYGGRYPCGSLVYDRVWYYGTYCLDETVRLDPGSSGLPLNWDVLGPFVGFRVSHYFGKTWEECPHTPYKTIFGETGKNGGKVRIDAPHFVDFGRNMEHSPDGKAYLVGHGAIRADAEVAWIRSD